VSGRQAIFRAAGEWIERIDVGRKLEELTNLLPEQLAGGESGDPLRRV
jgi:hypothetical protein